MAFTLNARQTTATEVFNRYMAMIDFITIDSSYDELSIKLMQKFKADYPEHLKYLLPFNKVCHPNDYLPITALPYSTFEIVTRVSLNLKRIEGYLICKHCNWEFRKRYLDGSGSIAFSSIACMDLNKIQIKALTNN